MDSRSMGATSQEELLVEQARRGSPGAYNQLVLANQALAYNLAYRLLGDSDAAADAVQDSLLKAYRGLQQGRDCVAYFRPWLLRIVINTCYDALRSRRRRLLHTVTIDEEAGDHEWRSGLRDRNEMPEDYVLRRELADRIQAAIERLPLDQRAVLILSDVEGLQYQEIAEIIAAPVGTVKSRLARARARLRTILRIDRGTSAAHAPVSRPTPASIVGPG